MTKQEKQYLQTEAWQKKRLARLKMDDYRCCRCGSKHNLQVHHITYNRLGREDVNNDLVTLCDACHSAIEHSPEIGSAYRNFLRVNQNYGVKDSVPLFTNSDGGLVICHDVSFSDYCMHFDNKKIRLCSARLSPSDYFEDEELYNSDKGGPFEFDLLDYEEYQWESDKEWLIFVKSSSWWYANEGLSFTFRSAKTERLNNGLLVLNVADVGSWEGYMSMGRRQAAEISAVLDSLQENYKNSFAPATGHNRGQLLTV